MLPATYERLFDYHHAVEHPVVRGALMATGIVLIVVPVLLLVLSALGRLKPDQRRELWARYFSWLIFIPLIVAPVLLGAAYTIGAVAVLSLMCYREFSRATGLFREHLVSLLVVLGILALTFAIADHWYGFFMALTPLTIAFIAALSILPDQPQGYIQRVALGVFAFLLFGVCFGHLGYMANDANYRAIILWLVVCIELNDIFAYIVGKSLGRRKLAPRTSPNKTVAGALGALVLTTALAATLGHLVFAGTRVDQPGWLILLGVILSATGQLGDLALSSIKRDLGIKDWAATFPGHGGLLDRFNSLLFAAPAVFHYVGYLKANGIGLDQPRRIITGG